jgi:protein required for attachment to host cells
MVTTWILVAHRGGAKIFKNTRADGPVTVIREIPHPEGRLKDGEIDTDKPGRSYSRGSMERHEFSRHQTPSDHLAETFAKQLALVLDEGRATGQFEQLIVVADRDFLGHLRSVLSMPTAKLVVAELNKNITELNNNEITDRLYPVILDAHRSANLRSA